jgi:hypothetical protein
MRACTVAIRHNDVPGTGKFGAFSGTVCLAAALLLPLIPAWFSWQIYEKQFLKLKRFFPSAGTQ